MKLTLKHRKQTDGNGTEGFEAPAKRRRSLSWKTKTTVLVTGAAAVAALAITGPARAAESNANDHATLRFTSGPNYVVTGYKPTYTANIRINHAHRIVDATTGGDCPGQSLGKLYADNSYDITCPFSTDASSSNSTANLTVSGTAKTWPYAGSGDSSSLSISRALTILDPKIKVTLTSASGSRRYDGESSSYIYLSTNVEVKNTGNVNLTGVSISASTWGCPTIPATLAIGATANVTCTYTIAPGTPTSSFTVNATGSPNVPAAELYPYGYVATGSDTITYEDDVDFSDMTISSTPITLHP